MAGSSKLHAAASRSRRISVLATAAFVAASAVSLGSPRPVAAAWERDLTVNFYTGTNFGDGRGRVTSDDGAIDCSWDAGVKSGDCSEHYVLPNFQTSYTIVLTLDPGTGSYVCVNTQFGCQAEGQTTTTQVTFAIGTPGGVTVTPSFTRAFRKIVGNIVGPGAVNIDAGTACTPPTNYEFCFLRKYGDVLTLSAVPNAGKVFSYWHGVPCSESQPVCQFALTEDKNVFALFGSVQLTFDATGSGEICQSTDGTLCLIPPITTWAPIGDTVTVEARPAGGWHFDRWNSGSCSGQDQVCSFTVQSTATIVATFKRNATPAPTPKPTPRPTPKPTAKPTPAPTATPRPLATASAFVSAAPSESPGAPPEASAAAESPTPTTLPGPTSAEPTTSIAPGTPASTEEPVAPSAGSNAPGASFMPLVLLALLAAIGTVLLGFVVGRRARRHA